MSPMSETVQDNSSQGKQDSRPITLVCSTSMLVSEYTMGVRPPPYFSRRKKRCLTQLFRVSGISLLLGALISLIAVLLAFFVNPSFTAPPATFQSPLWSTHYSLFFTALALTLIGLPALYFRLRGQRGDRLGFFGLLFIALGRFLALGMAGYFVSVLPPCQRCGANKRKYIKEKL